MAVADDKKRQRENLTQLKNEEAGRKARIKARRDAQRKAEAERKAIRRIKMAKMAGIWIGVIAIGLYALTWFSNDFVDWLHNIINRL